MITWNLTVLMKTYKVIKLHPLLKMKTSINALNIITIDKLLLLEKEKTWINKMNIALKIQDQTILWWIIKTKIVP